MGTSRHVAILLTVVLAGILTAGQDQPTASSQTAPRGPSNTRSASCLVRITVDPALLPLNPETVSSLIHSPAVELKALRDVLSVNTLEDFMRPKPQGGVVREPIMIRWLNTTATRVPPAARSPRQGLATGYDAEMMRQLEEVYGRDYMQQMMGSPGEEKKGEAKGGEASGSSQKESRPGPGRESRSGTPGMGAGGGMGMGGMGMGGMGGMMGGYGGMGGGPRGFYYGTPGTPQQDAGAAQSATIELQVNLPDTVPALADEFLKSVVRNLRDSLSRAYEVYRGDLQEWLDNARNQRRAAEAALGGAADDPAASQEVQRRLNATVDLSALNPQMPLRDAVDMLKKSLEPPLNIVVLWNNLSDHLRVEPTTPSNIDGMVSVRLGTALDLLVKGIPNRMGLAGTTWKIKDNVIVIGTVVALAESRDLVAKPTVETDALNLAGQRSELTRRVQALELDLAGIDARRAAIAAQTAGIRQRVSEKLSQDPVIQELEKLAQIHSTTVVQEKPGGPLVSVDTSKSEKAIRARIELANRREELSKEVGGSQLEESNKELSRLAIDKSEKEAQLKIVRQQLDEVQKQLAQALAFDPEAVRLRLAQESLDITGRRVTELQTRLANLQPPTVIMIGAN